MQEPKTKEEIDIIAGNELIVKFMGYERIRVGYYGVNAGDEDDETEFQRQNEKWLDDVGITDVGEYWVIVPLDLWFDAEKPLLYDQDWNQLMKVWIAIRSKVWQTNNGGYPVDFIKYIEDWKRECFNGHLPSCYHIVINAINWFNSTKQ